MSILDRKPTGPSLYSGIDPGKRTRPVDTNPVLADPAKALELVAQILGRKTDNRGMSDALRKVRDIRKEWRSLFELLAPLDLPHYAELYVRVMGFCDKLMNLKLAASIFDKTVLGLGGQFSSGKSSFINAIAGLNDLLYVNQTPSTSIPTFVMKGPRELFQLSGGRGRDAGTIDRDRLQAISYAFHKQYGIGFSAFIDSCIIQTPAYTLPENIVLLDTPGYSKPNNPEGSVILSDRQLAMSHLKLADHLIWLMSHENGQIRQSDIDFLEELSPSAPILFVVTYAESIGPTSMRDIISKIGDALAERDVPCYGVTCYSSPRKEEMYGGNIIPKFIEEISRRKENRKNDVNALFDHLVGDMTKLLQRESRSESLKYEDHRKRIVESANPETMTALSLMMLHAEARKRQLEFAKKKFSAVSALTKRTILALINGEKDDAR